MVRNTRSFCVHAEGVGSAIHEQQRERELLRAHARVRGAHVFHWVRGSVARAVGGWRGGHVRGVPQSDAALLEVLVQCHVSVVEAGPLLVESTL